MFQTTDKQDKSVDITGFNKDLTESVHTKPQAPDGSRVQQFVNTIFKCCDSSKYLVTSGSHPSWNVDITVMVISALKDYVSS